MRISRADKSRFADWWFTVDHVLLSSLFILMALGLVLSLAASPAVAIKKGYDTYYFVERHVAFGLAGAVMSDDLDRCERVAAALRAGIVWINCSQPTFTEAPWGGYKRSGIGRELGRWGFDAFRQVKQVTAFDASQKWGWYLK